MSSGITLTNNQVKDVMKVIKSLENRGVLLKESTAKIISQKGRFLRDLLAPLMRVALILMKNVVAH